MTTITITDRPCGYGKTTDILASFKPDEKYIVVLPFLSEVERVIKGAASKSATVLHAPLADHGTKTDHCSDLVKAGKSIACTHALFPRLGTLATEIAFETSTFMCTQPDLSDGVMTIKKHRLLDEYHVIIDEAIDPFGVVDTVTPYDFKRDYEALGLVVLDECSGKVTPTPQWDTRHAEGGKTFSRSLYEQAKSGSLYTIDGKLFIMTIPTELLFRPKSVTIYSYLVEGTVLYRFLEQLQRQTEGTSDAFTLKVDRLAHSVEALWRQDVSKALTVESINALEKYTWSYKKQTKTFGTSAGQQACRSAGNALKKWSGAELQGSAKQVVMLTCAKALWHSNRLDQQPMAGPLAKHSRLFGHASQVLSDDGKHSRWDTTGVRFVANTTRGVNDYIGCTSAVYLYDQFPNPQIGLFLGMPSGSREAQAFSDAYALSELVQWLFRSRIRCGGVNGTGQPFRPRNKVTIYIPSARMRNLLVNWLATGEVSSIDHTAKAIALPSKARKTVGAMQ